MWDKLIEDAKKHWWVGAAVLVAFVVLKDCC